VRLSASRHSSIAPSTIQLSDSPPLTHAPSRAAGSSDPLDGVVQVSASTDRNRRAVLGLGKVHLGDRQSASPDTYRGAVPRGLEGLGRPMSSRCSGSPSPHWRTRCRGPVRSFSCSSRPGTGLHDLLDSAFVSQFRHPSVPEAPLRGGGSPASQVQRPPIGIAGVRCSTQAAGTPRGRTRGMGQTSPSSPPSGSPRRAPVRRPTVAPSHGTAD